MEKLTISEALNELKLMDGKIAEAIKKGVFLSVCKKNETNKKKAEKNDEQSKEIEKSYNNVISLINRREKIKSAIVKSNAQTNVVLSGKTMTVTKLIDCMKNVNYIKTLTENLKAQLETAEYTVNKKNNFVEEKLDDLINTAFSRDNNNKIKSDDYSTIADPYREANEYSLVDPINVKKLIEENESYIDTFTTDADVVLQISNSTTTIEIDA